MGRKSKGASGAAAPAAVDPELKEVIKELDAEQQRLAKNSVKVEERDATVSARASFTLLPVPSTASPAFVFFGGEYFDSRTCKVYNDTIKWTPHNATWKHLVQGPRPKPRVGHSAVIFSDEIYVFGGEYATSSSFYHYRDLWRLEPKTLTWTEVACPRESGKRGAAAAPNFPCARSGHRMAVVRSVIALFGGFQEAGRETKYLNDLFFYQPSHNVWRRANLAPRSEAPGNRSGAVLGGTDAGLVLFGGYAKVSDNAHGAQGKVYLDAWHLDMRPLFAGGGGAAPDLGAELRWEKLKVKCPRKSGVGYAQHKSLIYTFGGVTDIDEGGVSLTQSIFFNDLACFDLSTKKWTRLTGAPTQAPPAAGETPTQGGVTAELDGATAEPDGATQVSPSHVAREVAHPEASPAEVPPTESSESSPSPQKASGKKKSGSKSAKELFQATDLLGITEHAGGSILARVRVPAELLFSAPVLQHKSTKKAEGGRKGEKKAAVAEPAEPTAYTVVQEMPNWLDEMTKVTEAKEPFPRMNASVAVKGGYVWVSGGTLEVKNRAIVFDDIWRFNLKTHEWECVWAGNELKAPEKLKQALADESDDESDGDDSGDEESTDSTDGDGSEEDESDDEEGDSDDEAEDTDAAAPELVPN